MPKIITNKAKIQCSLGASVVSIIVTSQSIAEIEGELIATDADNIPFANIPPFGACRRSSNCPPCTPSLIKWNATSARNDINGCKMLTKDSFCNCMNGGKISFLDSGMNTITDE